jgi:hypothetical protein
MGQDGGTMRAPIAEIRGVFAKRPYDVSEEMLMDNPVDVLIPIDAEAAQALQDPARRAAVGRYISHLLKGEGIRSVVAAAIAELKQEAHANGLTDEDVDEEIRAWRAERHG